MKQILQINLLSLREIASTHSENSQGQHNSIGSYPVKLTSPTQHASR